jgi:hypothetical protein
VADITDPVVLITLAQTVVLTLTLVIFIYQFRSQNEAIKDSAYQKALDDYSDSITLLVEKPELASLLEELAPPDVKESRTTPMSSPQRTAVFGFMLLNFSILERVYLLHAKKWIDEDTWDQWYATLKLMARHPMFREVHRRSEGTFDKNFMKLVADAISANSGPDQNLAHGGPAK